MGSPYTIRRAPQPDGIDYLLEPHDDEQIPVRAEKLLLGVMLVIVLSMGGSAIALLSHMLTARGILVGFPWWAVGVVGGLIVAVLAVHRWVFGLDNEEVRVAIRRHHVGVGSRRLLFTEITAIDEDDGELLIRTATSDLRLPAYDAALLADLRRGAESAQLAEPPAALRALQERAAHNETRRTPTASGTRRPR